MTTEPPHPPRPPVPAWLKALFLFGPIVGYPFLVWIQEENAGGQYPGSHAIIGAFIGLLLTVPSLSGLALASRYYSSVPARLLVGVAGGILFLLLILAVCYAGCLCLAR